MFHLSFILFFINYFLQIILLLECIFECATINVLLNKSRKYGDKPACRLSVIKIINYIFSVNT